MHCIATCVLSLSVALVSACGKREQPPAPTSVTPPVAGSSEAVAAAPPQGANDRPRPTTNGRYQIVVNPTGARAGPFLLDTQAGRIWQLSEFPGLQGAPRAWREMTIIDDTGEMGITTAQFQKLYPPRQVVPQRR
ncbi:hypothetical protein Tamer19_65970 [Cupriavidus sp. TA19]|uniref:hypothetical protein n=1 Tax=unclassified Cupriavidus TaxID=2640874 RepID=UPI000E2F1AE3|nr:MULTISPECIES: hypothetical protein [unclassified Cupriavidus]BDB26891.1 hypothetical protein CTP10_R42960 [Cupriavidus sp. P-10]GLC97188.1 hypothetical protein Tamer19_65970 [Cupriavidus sp. TA19]